MALLIVRNKIAETLKSSIDNVHVKTHGGPLMVETIKDIAVRAPAIVVACLGIPRMNRQGTVVSAEAVFGAFCITEDKAKNLRDAEALVLVESVMAELQSNNWGGTASSAPRDAVATNLYSTQLDNEGICLWGVRWRQLVDLERNIPSTYDDFDTHYATYELADATDDTPSTEDQTDL